MLRELPSTRGAGKAGVVVVVVKAKRLPGPSVDSRPQG